VGDRGPDLLHSVVDEIGVVSAHGEDVLVGASLERLDEDRPPRLPEVVRAGDELARLATPP
jgi:hypothetical protein